MTSQTTAAAPRVIDWRASITGGALILLALVIAFLLDSPWDSVSTFKISRPRDVWVVGHLTVPSQWFTTSRGVSCLREQGCFEQAALEALSLAIALVILAMAFLSGPPPASRSR